MKKKDTNIEIVNGSDYIALSYNPSILNVKEVIRVVRGVMKIPLTVINKEKKYDIKYKDKVIEEFYDSGINNYISIDISNEI